MYSLQLPSLYYTSCVRPVLETHTTDSRCLPFFERDATGLPRGCGKKADTGALAIPPCLVIVLHGAFVGELNVEPALQDGFERG